MKKTLMIVIGLLIALAGLAWAAGGIEPRGWGDVLQYALTIVPAIIAAAVVGIRNWPELIRSKTFWAGVSAIAAAVQQYAAGAIDLPTLIWAVLAGLAVIFIRDAQATAARAAEAAASSSEAALNAAARAGADPTRRR